MESRKRRQEEKEERLRKRNQRSQNKYTHDHKNNINNHSNMNDSESKKYKLQSNKSSKDKKQLFMIGIFSIFVMILVTVFILVSPLFTNPYITTDYLEYEIYGVDNAAMISATIDLNALTADLERESGFGFIKDLRKDKVISCMSSTEFKYDKNFEITNGDRVVIETESPNCTLIKDSNLEVVINDLTEGIILSEEDLSNKFDFEYNKESFEWSITSIFSESLNIYDIDNANVSKSENIDIGDEVLVYLPLSVIKDFSDNNIGVKTNIFKKKITELNETEVVRADNEDEILEVLYHLIFTEMRDNHELISIYDDAFYLEKSPKLNDTMNDLEDNSYAKIAKYKITNSSNESYEMNIVYTLSNVKLDSDGNVNLNELKFKELNVLVSHEIEGIRMYLRELGFKEISKEQNE